MTKAKEPQLGHTLSRLDAIISKLQDEEGSLESALAAFEEGIKLTRDAQQALQKAEQRVQMLIEKNGHLETEQIDTQDIE